MFTLFTFSANCCYRRSQADVFRTRNAINGFQTHSLELESMQKGKILFVCEAGVTSCELETQHHKTWKKLILLISVEETLGDYLSSAVMLSAILDGSHYQTSQHGYHSSTTKDSDLQQKPTTTKFGSIIIFDMFAAILNATHSQNRNRNILNESSRWNSSLLDIWICFCNTKTKMLSVNTLLKYYTHKLTV